MDTDKPKRGRPVSEQSRQAVLHAATLLLDERGYAGFTVDEVARRSGVSKATIYSHWRGAFAIAVAAFGDYVTGAVPVRSSGDAIRDLRSQIVRLAAFYASDRGRVAAQIIAASTTQDDGGAVLRDSFFAARRSATRELIRHGQSVGQLRADLDPDLVVDLLFGPIVFRLMNGEGALRPGQARTLADMALRAVAVG